MPSGRTHDRITWGLLPWMGAIAWLLTQRWTVAIALMLSFCFSGLMFGPDLDIPSRQVARWGWLRFIWTPYRIWIPHRSWWSHGPIIGTCLRIVYLGGWMGVVGGGGAIAYGVYQGQSFDFIVQTFVHRVGVGMMQLQQFPWECIGALIGLEAGAMSHSISDWLGSAWRRLGRRR